MVAAGRTVERDPVADGFPLLDQCGFIFACDNEAAAPDFEIGTITPGLFESRPDLWKCHFFDVFPCRENMQPHTVTDFSGKPQQCWAYRRDADRDRSETRFWRGKFGSHQGECIVLSLEIKFFTGFPASPYGSEGLHIFA